MSFWRANELAITVISVLIGSLVFWELVARVLGIPQFLLPAPSVVIAELFKAPGLYAVNSLATLRVTLTGFGLAVVLGILLAVALGLRSIEPDVMNMAKVMRASRWQILRRIRFPHALPAMFAGMKVAISLALVGTIVGEFVAGGEGLGSAILAAQGTFDTAQVLACIVLLGVLGTILFYTIDFLERRLMPWHHSQRLLVIPGE